jgi:hypothetical protein
MITETIHLRPDLRYNYFTLMKKAPFSRANAMILVESLVWIFITVYVRSQLDQAAARWQIADVWVFLLKIGVVLGLIAVAVWLHGLLYRWLVRRGILPAERQE